MWQEINAQWHCCHWWQRIGERRITAMTALVILALFSTFVLAYAVVHVLRHDPRRADLPGPRSHHHQDAPASWYDDHTTAA